MKIALVQLKSDIRSPSRMSRIKPKLMQAIDWLFAPLGSQLSRATPVRIVRLCLNAADERLFGHLDCTRITKDILFFFGERTLPLHTVATLVRYGTANRVKKKKRNVQGRAQFLKDFTIFLFCSHATVHSNVVQRSSSKIERRALRLAKSSLPTRVILLSFSCIRS